MKTSTNLSGLDEFSATPDCDGPVVFFSDKYVFRRSPEAVTSSTCIWRRHSASRPTLGADCGAITWLSALVEREPLSSSWYTRVWPRCRLGEVGRRCANAGYKASKKIVAAPTRR